jgi:hypothetical protein
MAEKPTRTTLEAALGGPVKILADGSQLTASDPRTDHVALLFLDGWMVQVATLSDGGLAFSGQHEATNAARADRLLGFTDWQLAPLQVWEAHVLDRSRDRPAVNPMLFPGIQSSWHWTSSACAWSKDSDTGIAACAWLVSASYGSVNGIYRSLDGFALAARRVTP